MGLKNPFREIKCPYYVAMVAMYGLCPCYPFASAILSVFELPTIQEDLKCDGGKIRHSSDAKKESGQFRSSNLLP